MSGPADVTLARPEGWTFEQMADAVLAELVAEPGDPISAHDLGVLLGVSGPQAGQYLRHLRLTGRAASKRVSPGSTRTLWHATDAGRAHAARSS